MVDSHRRARSLVRTDLCTEAQSPATTRRAHGSAVRVLFDDRRGVYVPFTGIGMVATLLYEALRHEPAVELVPVSSLGLKGADSGLTGPTVVRKLYIDQVALPLRARRKVDVYHALYHEASPLLLRPLVVNIYDFSILTSAASYSSKQRAYYGGLLRLLARRAHTVVVSSEWTAREMDAWCGRLRVRVVPCPLDPMYFEPVVASAVESTLTALELVGSEYVLYSGGLHARKSLAVLFEGVARAQTWGAFNGPLVLTGAPEATAQSLAVRSGCETRFTGVLPRPMIRDLYAGCAAVVSASVNEGFGYSAAEGAAMGRPVVCPDRGALAETAGSAAMTFRAEDARGLAGALGEAAHGGRNAALMQARAEARRFAPAKIAKEMIGCYQEAAS